MKNKSGLWNATFGEIGATLKVLEDCGINLELFTSLRTDKKLAKEVAGLIIGKSKAEVKAVVADEFILSIDYSKTVEQMIADGKYDWKDSDVNAKHFPLPVELIGKKVDVTAKIYHFNRNISSEAAIKEMDKDGYRPATLAELLALGVINPELQCQFPIVALGSVWGDSRGYRQVPCLGVGGHERGLRLLCFDGGWDDSYRFLAVRK